MEKSVSNRAYLCRSFICQSVLLSSLLLSSLGLSTSAWADKTTTAVTEVKANVSAASNATKPSNKPTPDAPTQVTPLAPDAVPMAIPDAPSIAAEGYVLIDYHSGHIITGKNERKRRSPASLTKMMTSYVIGQAIKSGKVSPDDDVVISADAWAQKFPESSKMFLEVGKTVKLRDLNHGIIIQSGNDACVAAAEHVAGSQEAFVSLMNKWVAQLGLKDTHFVNVHGLDDPNLYSTPYDMALIGAALIRDVPNEYEIYKIKSFTYNKITQHNRNALLWDKSLAVDGIKTGHTNNAGYSLVSSATSGDMRLIAVVMGTKSEAARAAESKKLLNYGFRFFETAIPNKAGDVLATETVWLGDTSEVKIGVANDVYVTVPKGSGERLKATFKLNDKLKAPLKRNDVVGTIDYTIDGTVVLTKPLVALTDVNEGGFFRRLLDHIILFFIGLFK